MLFYRSQKYAECEGCGRESQQYESDICNSGEDNAPHKTSPLPRSNHAKTMLVSLRL